MSLTFYTYRKDGGIYQCKAENSFGNDAIMHTLVVQAPPQPPSISLAGTSGTSITVRLKSPTDSAPLHGLTLHYKQDFGEWDTTQIQPSINEYTLEGLSCGTRYQLYATSYNGQAFRNKQVFFAYILLNISFLWFPELEPVMHRTFSIQEQKEQSQAYRRHKSSLKSLLIALLCTLALGMMVVVPCCIL